MTIDPDDIEAYLKSRLESLPDKPGVYRYFDRKGNLLYIGKAISLKKRVRSYFSGRASSYRIGLMVSQIAEIEYTVTNSEIEALTLENNLIKEHQPKYNVMLKDGKSYPFICIKNESFPRVFSTRNKIPDGSQYYGPYTSGTAMHAILDLIRLNFKLRTCTLNLLPAHIAAGKFQYCLEYQIGNCDGPCVAKVSEDAYMERIEQVRKILKGNLAGLLDQLRQDMQQAAADYRFEEAEEIRVRIDHIEKYRRKNTIVTEHLPEAEVLTLDTLNDLSIVNHFKIVNGGIIGAHAFEIRRKEGDSDEEILAAVFNRLASEDDDFSREILCNMDFGGEDIASGYRLSVPQRGDKRRLIELSLKNCKILLEEKVLKQNFKKKDPTEVVLEQLQKDLRLKSLPRHIECFDNSNNQGSFPVASMVVFKNAKPSNKDYRHFKIKTVEGPNDFASMEEIITRRYGRLLAENQPLPDLVVVDGGKGQLSSAAKALENLGLLDRLPLIGIAKKLEELFFEGDDFPLHLDKRSTSLKVIQHMRNEAHRFAITFHRDLRSKSATSTGLTQLEGVGEKTAQKLLRHFKSIKKLKAASEEEIAAVVGKKLAASIVAQFQK